MNRVFKTVAVFLLLNTVYLHAQEKYTLEKCIEFSLTHHASIGISQNNIQIAKEQKKQAVSSYLLQANSALNFTDNLKLPTTVIPAGLFGPNELNVQLGQQYNTNATIDVTQTIYDQSKLNNIKTGRTNVKISQSQDKQNTELLIYNTTRAYLQVLIYKEYELKLTDNIQAYSQLSKILELQLEKGVALETDFERIKVSLKSAEYQLGEVATQKRNALNNLKYAMGLPLEAGLTIIDSVNYEKYANFPDVATLALDSLSDYSINKTNVDLQKINYQNKKAAFLPTVTASARFASQAYDATFSKSFDKWKDYSYIGLSVNLPIFSSLKRSSQVKESKLVYTNARTNLDLIQKNYQLRFQNAEQSLLTSHNSFLSNRDNLNLAKKIFDKTNLNYQKGAVSLSDFLNDDTAYKNAQSNYLNSLFSYMIARLDYEKAKGTLFSFYNQLKNN